MILSLSGGKLVATDKGTTVVLDTKAKIDTLLMGAEARGIAVYESSSIHFPTEYTLDPAVLALVDYLTGASR
jgi:hypothetical protein